MARITVEDCLKNVGNRFLLVNLVAKRVRQIRGGSDLLVASKNEDVVVSLREVAAGRITARSQSVRPSENSHLPSASPYTPESTNC